MAWNIVGFIFIQAATGQGKRGARLSGGNSAIARSGHTNRGRVKQKSHKAAHILEVGSVRCIFHSIGLQLLPQSSQNGVLRLMWSVATAVVFCGWLGLLQLLWSFGGCCDLLWLLSSVAAAVIYHSLLWLLWSVVACCGCCDLLYWSVAAAMVHCSCCSPSQLLWAFATAMVRHNCCSPFSGCCGLLQLLWSVAAAAAVRIDKGAVLCVQGRERLVQQWLHLPRGLQVPTAFQVSSIRLCILFPLGFAGSDPKCSCGQIRRTSICFACSKCCISLKLQLSSC